MSRRVTVVVLWACLAALLAWLMIGAALLALNPGTGAPQKSAKNSSAPAQAGPLVLIAVGNERYAWITRRRDDAPIGATPEFVGAIYDDGWTIAICSARGLKGIGEWLMRWGFTGMGIQLFNEKPPAMVYLDDRGVTFTGDYNAALAAIDGFRAWWEAPDSDGGVARVM